MTSAAIAVELRRARIGIAFVVASAVAFGAMAILARFAFASGVDATTLLALRFTIAAFVMFAVLRIRGRSLPRGATLRVLMALGAAGYGDSRSATSPR